MPNLKKGRSPNLSLLSLDPRKKRPNNSPPVSSIPSFSSPPQMFPLAGTLGAVAEALIYPCFHVSSLLLNQLGSDIHVQQPEFLAWHSESSPVWLPSTFLALTAGTPFLESSASDRLVTWHRAGMQKCCWVKEDALCWAAWTVHCNMCFLSFRDQWCSKTSCTPGPPRVTIVRICWGLSWF